MGRGKARAPIYGPVPVAVAERPRCKWCNKPLRPVFETLYTFELPSGGRSWPPQSWSEHPPVTLNAREAGKRFTGNYGEDGYFCGQKHGYRFGHAVARDMPKIAIVRNGETGTL